MSSEMFVFDDPFFTDPLSDSSIDSILQEISSDEPNTAVAGAPKISADEAHSLDEIALTLLSNSPPSHQLETLTLSHLRDSVSDDVKTEEFQLGFDTFFLQRSYSSNSFEGKQSLFFQPQFDAQVFQTQIHDSGAAQIRRVCSTGDLSMAQQREGNFMEESNFKVGRYSAEERREKIDKYRAKRTQRNFNKTIKYACRKTLADNRPRIRGRFARNDETGEIPKPTSFHRYEDDDDLWVENIQEEEEERIGRGGRFVSNFGGTRTHFQYCGY